MSCSFAHSPHQAADSQLNPRTLAPSLVEVSWVHPILSHPHQENRLPGSTGGAEVKRSSSGWVTTGARPFKGRFRGWVTAQLPHSMPTANEGFQVENERGEGDFGRSLSARGATH